MWRACFLALGTFCIILGAEALVVEKVVMAADREPSSSEVVVQRKEYKPHEAAPWMLMSVGAVVVLYSFTIPRRVRD